jgi:hypothetical protein
MDFLDTVLTVLNVAKKGAEVYAAINPDKEGRDEGFAVRPMRTSTKRSQPARLQDMEQIIGLGLPQMTPTYSRFVNELASDRQLATLQASSFDPSMTNFNQKIKETMTLSDATVSKVSTSQGKMMKLIRNLSTG